MKIDIIRSVWLIAALAAFIAPALPGAEKNGASARIDAIGDDWNASPADVGKVLNSTAAQVLVYFPERNLKPILVSHWNGTTPITLDAKGPAGEYQVRLDTDSTYWAQYTYQFSHELCHILANYDHHHSGRNQWFEESLCETSSLFVLSRMRQAWEANPPYPNWKTWGVHFDEYLNDLLAKPSRRLPPDRTMPMWLSENLPHLSAERELTDRSKLVAAYLLPIFQADPEGWESLNWLNLGEKDDEAEFQSYLRGWRERVPERHREFIAKIQMLFASTKPAADSPDPKQIETEHK